MAHNHIISAIFLALISANMIQGGVIPGAAQLLHEGGFPYLLNLHGFGDLSHNFVTKVTSAASSAKDYFDEFGNRLVQSVEISPNTGLHHIVRKIWPSFTAPATGVVPDLVAPNVLGNYVADSSAASAGAASSGSGGLVKRVSV